MKLQLSMETGLRPVELTRLKVKYPDLEHKTVNPTKAKKGNPRTIPVSENPRKKLTEHIIRQNLTPTDLLFKGTDSDHYRKQYRMMINKATHLLQRLTITQKGTVNISSRKNWHESALVLHAIDR